MGLLRNAAGSIKDSNTILRNSLSRRCPHRNPHLEAAIIRATNHRELCFDYKQARIVFSWILTSPPTLSPFITPLTNRIQKTRSWAVALKALMLVHGVLHCNTPATKQLGLLHFELSTFTDGHSRPEKVWGFNLFVREYFAFLDLRLVYEFTDGGDGSVVQEMVDLQKRQALFGLLLQIRAKAANMRVGLILDAMECVLAEASQIQGLISRGIANLASKIDSSSKPQVAMALQILQKAAAQGEELAKYLEHCEHFGVVNADDIQVPKIPEEDIRVLEGLMINGGSKKEEEELGDSDEKAMVAVSQSVARLETVVTGKWEVFEEDLFKLSETNSNAACEEEEGSVVPAILPLVHVDLPPSDSRKSPDLITFY